MAMNKILAQLDPSLLDPSLAYQPQAEDMVNPETGVPNALSGVQNYGDQFLQMMQSPERLARLKQLSEKSQDALSQQRQGVQQNEQSIEGIKKQAALRPLAQLSDQWFGGNSAGNYASPEDLAKLQQGLQQQRQGLSSEEIALLKNQMGQTDMNALLKSYALGQRLDQRGQSLGIQDDKLAAQAAERVNSHPLIQKTTQQLGQIQIDRHTIETSPMVTPQILHEISNGIANALSGGRGVGLGMASMQDLSTAQSRIAQFEQYITNHPQEAASPAIKKQVVDTLNRLEDAYGLYQEKLAQQIVQGKSYRHSKQAQESQKSAAAQFKYAPKFQGNEAHPVDQMSDQEVIKAYNKKMGK